MYVCQTTAERKRDSVIRNVLIHYSPYRQRCLACSRGRARRRCRRCACRGTRRRSTRPSCPGSNRRPPSAGCRWPRDSARAGKKTATENLKMNAKIINSNCLRVFIPAQSKSSRGLLVFGTLPLRLLRFWQLCTVPGSEKSAGRREPRRLRAIHQN